MARAAAAAEDSKEAVERQRDFARQVKRDVDDLEGKLGGLERQVCFHVNSLSPWVCLRESMCVDCLRARRELSKFTTT